MANVSEPSRSEAWLGNDGNNVAAVPYTAKHKLRQRASVACSACRYRRIRCFVPIGERECLQCRSTGAECIIKNDDERKKPSSKAYMRSLTDRIAVLERMLSESGLDPPPTQSASTTFNTAPNTKESPSQPQGPPEPTISNQDLHAVEDTSPEFIEVDNYDFEDDEARLENLANNRVQGDMVKRLLSTTGIFSLDRLSGRRRFFGSTTNCHIYSEPSPFCDETTRRAEQQRQTEMVIQTLSPETHDYLLNLFWEHYNCVLHVVHEEAFRADLQNGGTQFYSGFLHICILAMGFRFADKARQDIQWLALPHRNSILHREAKSILDGELELGGIPLIAALLLLGDLECGVGRDNLGWLFAGMATRLCFDAGLHLDSHDSSFSTREIEVRRMTLWACLVYDKYWAMYLGRPTSLKSTDLKIDNLSAQFNRLGTCQPAGPTKGLETQIYEALLDLMELSVKITDIVDTASNRGESPLDHHPYLRVIALDRELRSWYSRLARPLQWIPENIESAPISFFLLHQQYHSTLILLHRPFACYDDPQSALKSGNVESNGAAPLDEHFSAISRTMCTRHAVRVSQIFWEHRHRFDSRRMFVSAMQHAGTAAIALVAALAFIKDPQSRARNMQYLNYLAAVLQDMTHAYQPAERMYCVLQEVMVELVSDIPTSHRATHGAHLTQPGYYNDQEIYGQQDQFGDRQAPLQRGSQPSRPGEQSAPRPSVISQNFNVAGVQRFMPEMMKPPTTRNFDIGANESAHPPFDNDFVVIAPGHAQETPTTTWAKSSNMTTPSFVNPAPSPASLSTHSLFEAPATATTSGPFSLSMSTGHTPYFAPMPAQPWAPRFFPNPDGGPLPPIESPFPHSNASQIPQHQHNRDMHPQFPGAGGGKTGISGGNSMKAMDLTSFLNSTNWAPDDSRGLFGMGTGDLDGFPPIQPPHSV